MKISQILLTLLLLGQSGLLQAADRNIWCSGKLDGVYVNTYGEVTIKGDWGTWTQICNTKTPTAVDAVTCSLWASYAATAVKDNLDVMLMYSTSYDCNTLPAYSAAPTPFYFMLKPTK